MKILPLAKIAAARKRLIEQTKEMKMPIDVEALIAQVDDIAPATWNEFSIEFARRIIEECAKVCEQIADCPEPMDGCAECAAAIRALKP